MIFIKLYFNSQDEKSTYSDDLQKKVCDFQKDITMHALENVQKVRSLREIPYIFGMFISCTTYFRPKKSAIIIISTQIK